MTATDDKHTHYSTLASDYGASTHDNRGRYYLFAVGFCLIEAASGRSPRPAAAAPRKTLFICFRSLRCCFSVERRGILLGGPHFESGAASTLSIDNLGPFIVNDFPHLLGYFGKIPRIR